jgi:hypothetical protein
MLLSKAIRVDNNPVCTRYLAKIKHRYGKHGRSLEPVEGIKGFFGPILYT